MNKERILILAKLLEMAERPDAEPKFGFNMSSFEANSLIDKSGHQCGTAGCIAGWAIRAFTPNIESIYDVAGSPGTAPHAASLLDLDTNIAYDLFFPSVRLRHEVTPRQAAKVLRNLIKTGQVDWSLEVRDTNR